MKTAIELIEALRYILRMFDIPIAGSVNVYCDNESVCNKTTRPESTLKKKHNAIAYHQVREAVVAGMIGIAKEDSAMNISEMLMKCVDHESLTRFCGYLFICLNIIIMPGFSASMRFSREHCLAMGENS